jgi:hypothetical protein
MNANKSWAIKFFNQLHGNPCGKTYRERNGYGLELVYDKVRGTFKIVKRADVQPRHYVIRNVDRLIDAIEAHLISPGEESVLWEEYRNFYKWELPKEYQKPDHVNTDHLDNGPLGDDWSVAGPCCIWPREWDDSTTDISTTSCVMLGADGHPLKDDDALMADAIMQARAWRKDAPRRNAYYWANQFAEEMNDLRELVDQCNFLGATETQLYDWLEEAQRQRDALGEPTSKTVKAITRIEQIIDILDNAIVERQREDFRFFRMNDNPEYGEEY